MAWLITVLVFFLPIVAMGAEPSPKVLAAARATIQVHEDELTTAYTAAGRRFDPEMKIANLTKIRTREELTELENQLRVFRESDAAMRDAFVDASNLYRDQLMRAGADLARATTLAKAFESETERQLRLVISEGMRPGQIAFFDTVKEVLDLAGTHFQAWEPVAPAGFRFKEEKANVRYRALMRRIAALADEDEKRQKGTEIALDAFAKELDRKYEGTHTITSITMPEGMEIKNEAALRQRGVIINRTSPLPPIKPAPAAPGRTTLSYSAGQPDLQMAGPQLVSAIQAAPRVRFGAEGTERGPLPYTLFRFSKHASDFLFAAKSSPPVMTPGGEILLPRYFGETPRVVSFKTLAEGRQVMGDIDVLMTGNHRELTSTESQTIDTQPVPGIRVRVEGTKGIVVTLPADISSGDYALVISSSAGPGRGMVPVVYDFEVKAKAGE